MKKDREVHIGVRISASLAEDLDNEVKKSLEFCSRSDLIRQILTQYVTGIADLQGD